MALDPKTSIGRLRIIGIFEGISMLVLLFIAMPLKYFAGIPEAVKMVGWIHGILFVAFCLRATMTYQERGWKFSKLVLAVIAAFLPFGTFVFDRKLKEEERALTNGL